MTSLVERLEDAAFPADYAGLLAETLGITGDNFLAVKDALFAFRSLDDEQAGQVMETLRDSVAM